MSRPQNGEHELRELGWPDEALQEVRVQQRDRLVDDLQSLYSKLWIDAGLVHLEDLVEHVLGDALLLAGPVFVQLVLSLAFLTSDASFTKLDI